MPTRIRILCVVDNLEVGGVREVVVTQLHSLDPDRFEIGLLTLADDHERARDLLPSSVARLGVSYRAEYGYGVIDYLSDAWLLRAARTFGAPALHAIERFDPHILHFHTNPRELGLGILSKRRMPVTLVFTDHLVRIRPTDYSFAARLLLRVAYRRLYRQCHVISVGSSVARFNRYAGFLNPSRIHLLLENQIDLRTFHPPAGEACDRPLTIIYVGRIHPVKGVDTLIRAFAQLRVHEPVRLVVVGPDAMGGAMQELADRVVSRPLEAHFAGARTDVPSLLRNASIGVLPSRREGLSLALLEQMASCLAVVVSDIPELTDIVSDGVDGLVVPVDDAVALAGALQRLVEDRQLRSRLGRAARAAVERRENVDVDQQLARFYDTIAR